jgi:hypothetical protein
MRAASFTPEYNQRTGDLTQAEREPASLTYRFGS